MTTDYTYFSRYLPTSGNAYVLVNYTTGEVRCIAGSSAYGLRRLYKNLDAAVRLAKLYKSAVHVVLANVRTGKVIAEVNRDFEAEALIEELYESMEV